VSERVENALRGSPNCQDQESCKDWEWWQATARQQLNWTQLNSTQLQTQLNKEKGVALWQPQCVLPRGGLFRVLLLLLLLLLFSRSPLQFSNEPQLSQVSSRFFFVPHPQPPPHTCPDSRLGCFFSRTSTTCDDSTLLKLKLSLN